MIIPVFSRRPIVGYTWVALSTVMTGLVGFGVWVHHMFATGLPYAVDGILQRGEHDDLDLHDHPSVRVARNDLDRPARAQDADAVRARLHLS